MSAGRAFDLTLLFCLFALVLLHRLALVATWITDFRVRELLYLILYCRIVFFYRIRVTGLRLLVFLYLACCVLVGLHTYYLYGSEMAAKGLMRFVYVALLAPLVAVLISTNRQMTALLAVWLCVVGLGAASGVYQLMGGDLEALTGAYHSDRGDVIRHMTLLGEPNVGGMSSPLVLLLAMFVVERPLWRFVWILVSVVLLLISVSKAAIVGFVLAVLMMVWLPRRRRSAVRVGRAWAAGTATLVAFATLLWGLTIVSPEFVSTIKVYAGTGWQAVLGDRETSPSIITDLNDRLFVMFRSGLELAQRERSNYALDVVIGSSYGIAGSAAQEVRGEDAVITPHNGFAETYFVGGVALVVVFVALIVVVAIRLRGLSRQRDMYVGVFAGFVLSTLFMVSYPVMYAIVPGAFFWVCVGVASNRWIARECQQRQA